MRLLSLMVIFIGLLVFPAAIAMTHFMLACFALAMMIVGNLCYRSANGNPMIGLLNKAPKMLRGPPSLVLLLALSAATAFGQANTPPDYTRLKNLPTVDARRYGVKADGSTNDRVALQAAIDATPTNGVCLLPKGTIYLGTGRVKITRSNITLAGQGIFNTKFVADHTTGLSYPILIQHASAGTYLENIELRDFSIDSSAWGIVGSTPALMSSGDPDNIHQNVRGVGRIGLFYVRYFRAHNLRKLGGHGGILDLRAVEDAMCNGIYVRDCEENAFNFLDGCERVALTNFVFKNVGEGIDLIGREISITNGTITLATTEDEGIDIQTLNGGTITNVAIYGGTNSINVHGGMDPGSAQKSYLSVSNLTITGVTCREFQEGGFTMKFGTSSTTSYTAGSGSTTTSLVCANSTSTTLPSTLDGLVGAWVVFSGSTTTVAIRNEYRQITAASHDGTKWTLTLNSALSGTPVNTDTFALHGDRTPGAANSVTDLTKSIVVANSTFISSQDNGSNGSMGMWLGSTNFGTTPTGVAGGVRVADITVVGCTIRSYREGIYAPFVKGLKLIGNTITSTTARPIRISANQTYFAENVDIFRNTVTGNSGGSVVGMIDISYGIDITVDGNTIVDAQGATALGIRQSNVRSPRTSNNKIMKCVGNGILHEWTADAYTDAGVVGTSGWYVGTARKTYLTGQNANSRIENNEVRDWGSATGSSSAVRVTAQFAAPFAGTARGIRITDNTMILDTVALNSHSGVRVVQTAPTTAVWAKITGNELDGTVSTAFSTSGVTFTEDSIIQQNIAPAAATLQGTGTTVVIDGFWQDNVAASQTGVTVTYLVSTPTNGANKWIAPKAGIITGIFVESNAARSAGTLTVEVTKNGTGSGLTAVLDATNTTRKFTTQNLGSGLGSPDRFVGGDEIGVTITTDASWSPITADIRVVIMVEI